ncbi:MAG: ATP-grasp domain-containing protein [Hyphomicrobiales bacterium]
MSSTKGRVIVTYGRSLMALAIARSLGQRGVEVVGVDDVDLTVLSFSKWATTSAKHAKASDDPDAFLDDLEAIIREHAPDDDRPYVLMPIFNETQLIAKHADRFSPLIKVAVPRKTSIDALHPKDAFARTVNRLDLPAPKSFACDTQEDLDDAADALSFPCIIKPADGVGGRGISKVDSVEELGRHWQTLKDEFPGAPVVQALSEGDDYCYCFLAKDGEIVADMAYRNLMSYPADYGAGVVRETIDHAPFQEAARTLVGEAGWTGVGQIDFMWTGKADDTPQMIELNPRFWANLDHSISSGVDFPWMLYEQTVSGTVSDMPRPEIGHQSKLPGLWLLAALEKAKSDTNAAALSENNAALLEKLKSGNIADALKAFASNPNTGLGLRQSFQALKKHLADVEAVETAGLEDDDPLIGLGILFVLGSLLEHGELPPELKA